MYFNNHQDKLPIIGTDDSLKINDGTEERELVGWKEVQESLKFGFLGVQRRVMFRSGLCVRKRLSFTSLLVYHK